MQKKVWLSIVGVVLLVGLGLMLIPIQQKNIITFGIDRYENHRPLFGSRTITQEVLILRELRGVGALLVDLRRNGAMPDVQVRVVDPSSQAVLATTTLPGTAINDDSFTFAEFTQPLQAAHQLVRIELTSPSATSTNPVGIRFHNEDVYPAGALLENGVARQGDAAIALSERVSLWRYLITTITNNQHIFSLLLIASSASLLVALLALRFGWTNRAPLTQHRVEVAILVGVAILGIVSRLAVLPDFKGVSGGDPYNYLFISQSLATGENPFAGVKRLPGYPLLLIPALLTDIDDHIWMRSLSSIAAGISILLIALLARRAGLPWAIQISAAAVLAWQKDFWWVSLRPEPYTIYTLLLLLCLYLYFNLKLARNQVFFGLALGYAAMTRQEGFVAAALFGIAFLLFWRALLGLPRPAATPVAGHVIPQTKEWGSFVKSFARTFLPALLIVLPFFVHNTATYGNPVYTPYFEGERLQIVDTWASFHDSLGATWGVLGSMWRPVWEQEQRVETDDLMFWPTLVLLTMLWIAAGIAKTARGRQILLLTVSTLSAVVLVATLWIAFTNKPLFSELITVSSAALLLVCSIPFLLATGWRGFIIVLIGAAQIMVALWFHPFSKHYQQAYPLLVLGVVTSLLMPLWYRTTQIDTNVWSRIAQALYITAILTPFALTSAFLGEKLPLLIDKYNEATALDSVVYRAMQVAKEQPGPYGIDQAYLPARLYTNDVAQYFEAEGVVTRAQEDAWLQQHDIRTLVVTNNTRSFRDRRDTWEVLGHFKSTGKDDLTYESFVYRLPD